MKKAVIALAALFLTAGIATAVEPAAKESKSATDGDFAILFDLKSLLLATDSFEDGYQAGAGLKWWMLDAFALRGLLAFESNTLEDVTETVFGISAGVEWHPARTRVSPYVGAFAGTRVLAITDMDTALDLYGGAMAGAEVRLWQNIALFAEYQLVVSDDIDGVTVRFGGPDCVQVGLAIYFM